MINEGIVWLQEHWNILHKSYFGALGIGECQSTIVIAQKNDQCIIKTYSFLCSMEEWSKCSFLSALILKNEAAKVEKQLADIKDEDKEEWDTLIFERNTRKTLGLSECTWQTGCSTALNTAVIQNTWNTCFYLGSVSEQEHIFHSCSLVYGNFKSHFGNMRHLKKWLCMKHQTQKRGKSAWGKTICLQMVLPKKHYSTYAHAGGPRHATQTDVFDRTASSLVALVINLMVTDFYLETPHCLVTSNSRCCYVSCRRLLFSSFQEHCGGS